MRVILKPGGIATILTALAALVILFVRQNGLNPALGARGIGASAGASFRSSAENGGVPLIEEGDFEQGLPGKWVFTGIPTVIKQAGPEGAKQYLHMHVVPGSESWAVRLGQRIEKPLKAGDLVVFRGWFRSPESLVLHFYVEDSGGAHAKTVSHQLFLTPQWSVQTVQGTVNHDFAPDGSALMIHFGILPGAVDMANFRLEDYGQVPESTNPPSPAVK